MLVRLTRIEFVWRTLLILRVSLPPPLPKYCTLSLAPICLSVLVYPWNNTCAILHPKSTFALNVLGLIGSGSLKLVNVKHKVVIVDCVFAWVKVLYSGGVEHGARVTAVFALVLNPTWPTQK